MKNLRITPAARLEGELAVPGDKSMSHRSVIFGSLAHGPTRVSGFLPGEDCLCTLRIFQALGTAIEVLDPTTLLIEGAGRKFRAPLEPLDCGNSGTSMRLISGVLAGQPFRTKLFGDASLSRRPMKRIMEPLGQMGARITASGARGTAPLDIEGTALHGITYQSPVASAQVKSCVLLAGLFAEGTTTVQEPTQSRNHTERLLEHFHLRLQKSERGLSVQGGSELHGEDLRVPGDFSSAAFWLAGAAARPGSNLIIRNVGLNPTRTGLLNVLSRMGAQIRETIDHPAAEPFGSLQIIGGLLRATEIGGTEIPNVIDEIPIISVMAALAKGTTVIRDAAELRVKESDRIKVMAENLRAFGVPVQETQDGMVIEGGAKIRAARVTSHGDHRIAMACAILALSADGPSLIEDVDCIETSYPGFAGHLEFLASDSRPNWPRRLWQSAAQIFPRSPRSISASKESSLIIAIDGPAASGKSSAARAVARQLGFAYINTGALYRGVTWQLLQENIDPKNAGAVTERVAQMTISCGVENGELAMQIDGVDPLPFVREAEINAAVSPISAVPAVREKLLALQRSLTQLGSLVVEGRDIGTTVFPQTPHKFFLDADPDVRQRRRAAQGEFDPVQQRDAQDSSRAAAPLQRAADAVIIDTGALKLDEVVAVILQTLSTQGVAHR